MANNAKETRLFPRVRYTSPIRLQIRGTNRFCRTIGENVSETGICFVNDGFIAPSTPVMFELEVLSRVLTPIGKIVWTSPFLHSDRYRLGTEFVEFEGADKKFLSDYVRLNTLTV
jgi:hypothetical protein